MTTFNVWLHQRSWYIIMELQWLYTTLQARSGISCIPGSVHLSRINNQAFFTITRNRHMVSHPFIRGVWGDPSIPNIPVSDGRYPNIPVSHKWYPNLVNWFVFVMSRHVTKCQYPKVHIPISKGHYPKIQKTKILIISHYPTNTPLTQNRVIPCHLV